MRYRPLQVDFIIKGHLKLFWHCVYSGIESSPDNVVSSARYTTLEVYLYTTGKIKSYPHELVNVEFTTVQLRLAFKQQSRESVTSNWEHCRCGITFIMQLRWVVDIEIFYKHHRLSFLYV